MSKDPLSPEARARQKAGIKAFHANKDKPTSANSIKEPRAITDTRRKITGLTDPSVELISKAVRGDLVAERSVWKGSQEERDEILAKDPSASFEYITLDNGKEVEVLVEYVPVSPKRVEIAKWCIQTDIALKKAAEDSKLRKLEAALKEKKARDEGALQPKAEEEAEKAKASGAKPRLVLDFIPDEEDEDSDE